MEIKFIMFSYIDFFLLTTFLLLTSIIIFITIKIVQKKSRQTIQMTVDRKTIERLIEGLSKR